jgi:flagellar protein FlaI
VERDFLGLGKIEPLMRDSEIEDISCDGVNIPIYVYHRNPSIGSVQTNVIFTDKEELDSFVIRLAQVSGKSISVAEPLVDATLPDGSRLQATLGTDIAKKGSNFTIRKFMEEPLTPTHLLNYKTIDSRALAYLWLAVDFGRSILIAGGTASGKTTLLNVLSLFIRPEKRIVSIEDTSELLLPHPHWVSTVARTPISRPGKEEVDLFKLLKESIRQRPEYIVVGEVRGQEAFILFQQISTGHPSLATIHADTIERLFDKLITPPISLPPGLIGSLDLVVFLCRTRYKEKFVRRVTQILEMIRYDEKKGKPIVNKVFEWNPFTDKIEVTNKSTLLKKISSAVGITESELVEELKRRTIVLEWMQKRNITSYRDVYALITEYYHNPNHVLALAMKEVV